GPSAGITMACALVSLGRHQRPPAHLAMTGELTLTGRVLPVGGIKEKVIAAIRSRVTRVILPKNNEKDFLEIPEHVRAGITPHYVEDFNQVFHLVFAGALDSGKPPPAEA
ncbi:MAG: S16 family serine protease, partial [Lentisphaeria bacterium]